MKRYLWPGLAALALLLLAGLGAVVWTERTPALAAPFTPADLPAGTAGRDLPGWPSCDPGVVNVHPLLWPSTREALARWELWARDHPDRAKKSLADVPPAELRAVREDLKAALGEIDTALSEEP
jgi:uncharacterized iron-regulated membrane protein